MFSALRLLEDTAPHARFQSRSVYESTTARLLLLVVILTGLQAHQLPRLFAPTRQSESRSNRGIIKVKMERPTVGCASQGTALLILQP